MVVGSGSSLASAIGCGSSTKFDRGPFHGRFFRHGQPGQSRWLFCFLVCNKICGTDIPSIVPFALKATSSTYFATLMNHDNANNVLSSLFQNSSISISWINLEETFLEFIHLCAIDIFRSQVIEILGSGGRDFGDDAPLHEGQGWPLPSCSVVDSLPVPYPSQLVIHVASSPHPSCYRR